MARVKHMGIVCREPELLKDYYCRWFGFEELKRLPDGTVYLTDGYLNVGLLNENSELTEANSVLGLHHVGFRVESIEEITTRLKQFDASMEIEKRPENDPYSQYRLRDPEGLHIDLSEQGYGVEGEKRTPGIRHIATGTSDLERKLRLYEKVFGMREVEMNRGINEAGARTRGCMADGFVNLCLVKRETDPRSMSHFGILMRRPDETIARLHEAYPTRTELWEPERPGVEFHIRDLEHNAVSLSDKKGWEVDVGKWDRIE
jgi:catechol 2,3-dioxygenase-like lactoylglutathione lyase family enzyme